MKINKLVVQYYDNCTAIKDEFLEKYYCDEDQCMADLDWEWEDGDIGAILCINGNRHLMKDMVTALKFNVKPKVFFDWHREWLDNMFLGDAEADLRIFLTNNGHIGKYKRKL